jgi:sulfonate transport system substrate-binding protein
VDATAGFRSFRATRSCGGATRNEGVVMNTHGKRISALIVALLVSSLGALSARAEDKPAVIRLGYPGVGVGNRPASQGNSAATAHLRGLFEEEFKKDGIEVKWTFLRGAGPAVNELFANGLLDFSHLGDLPSVIGRASGLPYRVLAASGVRGNVYVSVPADANVQALKDLKGKRLAVAKGTSTHLAALKILESAGLTEKDVKLINMDTTSAQLALTTRDIDAVFGGADYLRVRDQGISRIIFSTLGKNPDLTANGSWIGSEAFMAKYPKLTTRVVKVFVQAAQWLATAQPTQVFQLWTKSGTTFSSFREEWQGEDIKYRTSPLLDPYMAARYKLQIKSAHRLNLIRSPFEWEKWIEPKFLQAALQELKLENFWQPRGVDGKPVQPDLTRAAAAPTPAAAPATGGATAPAPAAPGTQASVAAPAGG